MKTFKKLPATLKVAAISVLILAPVFLIAYFFIDEPDARYYTVYCGGIAALNLFIEIPLIVFQNNPKKIEQEMPQLTQIIGWLSVAIFIALFSGMVIVLATTAAGTPGTLNKGAVLLFVLFLSCLLDFMLAFQDDLGNKSLQEAN